MHSSASLTITQDANPSPNPTLSIDLKTATEPFGGSTQKLTATFPNAPDGTAVTWASDASTHDGVLIPDAQLPATVTTGGVSTASYVFASNPTGSKVSWSFSASTP
jgi:hypothetical protein